MNQAVPQADRVQPGMCRYLSSPARCGLSSPVPQDFTTEVLRESGKLNARLELRSDPASEAVLHKVTYAQRRR